MCMQLSDNQQMQEQVTCMKLLLDHSCWLWTRASMKWLASPASPLPAHRFGPPPEAARHCPACHLMMQSGSALLWLLFHLLPARTGPLLGAAGLLPALVLVQTLHAMQPDVFVVKRLGLSEPHRNTQGAQAIPNLVEDAISEVVDTCIESLMALARSPAWTHSLDLRAASYRY